MPTYQADIAAIIQLSVAPVFMIAGIGSFLSVMTNRLARVVDRYRLLEFESDHGDLPSEQRRKDLHFLDIRMARISRAIKFSTLAALLVCIVIIVLFTEEILSLDFSLLVAALFLGGVAAMAVALIYFLSEIRYAEKMLRVRRDLL